MAVRPTVAIIGDSGTGKSSCMDTLPDPSRVCILNTENKELPAKNFGEFKNIYISSYKKLDATLDALKTKDYQEKFDYVILDSFTSLTEMVDAYCNQVYNGYEVWGQYNLLIGALIKKIKVLPMQVFIIAIPEQKSEAYGETKEYARVKGKELKFGFLEKELAIVLYTNPIYAEDDDPDNDIEEGEMLDVNMIYKANKKNSAKAPRGLFDKRPPNDFKKISECIDKYYGNTN